MQTMLQKAVVVAEGRLQSIQTPSDLWTGVLTGKHPDRGLSLIQESGILKTTFPEIYSMVGFGGHGQGHKDLWDHTLKVVRQTKNRPHLRWAALWHDVGKVETIFKVKGKVSFHQHEYVSARLFKQAMRRTHLLGGDFQKQVHRLVRDLGLLEGYSSEWTDSAVRRLHKQLGDHFDDVLLLARADVTSKHLHKRERVHQLLHELSERAKAIAAADAIVPPLPKGLGNALMGAFGLPPSKRLGEVKVALEAAVEAGKLEAHKDVAYYVDFLINHRADFGL